MKLTGKHVSIDDIPDRTLRHFRSKWKPLLEQTLLLSKSNESNPTDINDIDSLNTIERIVFKSWNPKSKWPKDWNHRLFSKLVADGCEISHRIDQSHLLKSMAEVAKEHNADSVFICYLRRWKKSYIYRLASEMKSMQQRTINEDAG